MKYKGSGNEVQGYKKLKVQGVVAMKYRSRSNEKYKG